MPRPKLWNVFERVHMRLRLELTRFVILLCRIHLTCSPARTCVWRIHAHCITIGEGFVKMMTCPWALAGDDPAVVIDGLQEEVCYWSLAKRERQALPQPLSVSRDWWRDWLRGAIPCWTPMHSAVVPVHNLLFIHSQHQQDQPGGFTSPLEWSGLCIANLLHRQKFQKQR